MDQYRELRRLIAEWAIENKRKHDEISRKIDAAMRLIKKMNDKPLIIEGEMTETAPPSKSVYYHNPESEPE